MDKLLQDLTAFRNWADLKQSMDEHGYVPTLRYEPSEYPSNRDARIRTLMILIVCRGYRVFFNGKHVGSGSR